MIASLKVINGTCERWNKTESGMIFLQLYLYNKEIKKVTFSDFINRELILFSNMDNERSIPSMVDGKCPIMFNQVFHNVSPSFNHFVVTCDERQYTREK